MSKDLNGLADPYLVVSLGKICHNDRDGHACDVLSVDFGKYVLTITKTMLVRLLSD